LAGRSQNGFRRLRALAGAIAILLTHLTFCAAFATSTYELACAMACCVADGYCCCKLSSNAANRDLSTENSIVQPNVSSSCPDGCTNSVTNIKVQRVVTRTVIQQAGPDPVSFTTDQLRRVLTEDLSNLSSPRAPPPSIYDSETNWGSA
jgi:hypothetical protein